MTQPRMPQLQGNPIWFNLATPDAEGAKQFYTGLFGWEWADVPMSGGSTYHMAIRDDANIAGMYQQDPSDTFGSVWINQVFVDDAEDMAKRIEANGGQILSAPTNADGWGVSAVVTTHEGAVFGMWQSLMGYGADVFGEAGAVCWVEYHSHDLDSSKSFYSSVFGSSFDEIRIPDDDGSGSGFTLTILSIDDEQMSCAFAELPDDSMPAAWATYFMVEDIHASVTQAQSLGAELTFGVMEVPTGAFASLIDPQGVRFNLWQSAG